MVLLIVLLVFFVQGIKEADEAEMRQMASSPHNTHVYNVPDFNVIKSVQQQLITEVCTAVDEQLNSLASGEEGELGWLSVRQSVC